MNHPSLKLTLGGESLDFAGVPVEITRETLQTLLNRHCTADVVLALADALDEGLQDAAALASAAEHATFMARHRPGIQRLADGLRRLVPHFASPAPAMLQ